MPSHHFFLKNHDGLANLTVRLLIPGECRRRGDFWYDGFNLMPVKLRWWSRRRIPNHGWAPHYRVVNPY